MNQETLEADIRAAFSAAPFPGPGHLTGSRESEEAQAIETEFADKSDWTALKAEFLNQAPQGHGSALSFFSHAALRFYLPAYLLADLAGQASRADVVFHLCHGFDNASKDTPINPRRYGDKTWFQNASERFAAFTHQEAAAITHYLEYKLQNARHHGPTTQRIQEALDNYWSKRTLQPHR